jgi:hypothetical protein
MELQNYSKVPIDIESHVDALTDTDEIVNVRVRTAEGKGMTVKMLKSDNIRAIHTLVSPHSDNNLCEFDLQ